MYVIDQTKTPRIKINSGKLQADFLPTGDLYRLGTKEMMINQVLSNPIDGALNNIYLRLFNEDGSIFHKPLLGIQSDSQFEVGKQQVKWVGEFKGVQYVVVFALLNESTWVWDVKVSGYANKVDLIYTQDVGLASQEAVQTNEAYNAQYVDHSVHNQVVCSRQNMDQSNGKFPYLEQGSLEKIASYSTDGFQFFGTNYKETDIPVSLDKPHLSSEVLQYEFNFTALQVEPFVLSGEKNVTFYGYFLDNHPNRATKALFKKESLTFESEESFEPLKKIRKNPIFGKPLITHHLKSIKERYPNRIQEEFDSEECQSFFTEEYSHVVLKEKEINVERPHGHIMFSGGHQVIDEAIMTTTSWMYGVFNAQTLVGNTDMNKWITNTRNALNIFKTSGQRIYVKLKNQYHLLAMPSAFEMGFNYAKWIYETEEETFEVIVFSTVGNSEIRLQLKAESEKKYEYLVTNQIVMDKKEYNVPVYFESKGNELRFYSDKKTLNNVRYPELYYRLLVEGTNYTIQDESFFAEQIQPGAASLLILELDKTSHFEIRLLGPNGQSSETRFEDEVAKFKVYFQKLMRHFELSKVNGLTSRLEKLNIITWWYTHNMLVHYLVPHGLEQYGGAAWGTRDVSQGPAEYFMAMQHFDIVKEIIKTTFSHQFEEDGNWPQWFMFDRYRDVYAHESHGDIIVWPLKLVADYLEKTGDYSILDERVPYMNREKRTFSAKSFTLRHHLDKEISYIQNHFLWDTHLSCYGDGDWDDTLQPHNQMLKENMASSWTIALTYEALMRFSQSIKEINSDYSSELSGLAKMIQDDYNRYIMTDDIVPGFVYMKQPKQVEFMIHPTDVKTGIQYRLLPMIQGITSEIFTKNQADHHYEIINKHLVYPDGVRLMNRQASYNGGVSTNFKRAEQAANFGREVGLLYVHAHIRFIESMAKMGKTTDVWKGLEIINPINIQDVVPNAAKRQSNAYFSSSDGDFDTRYEAEANFDGLKTGEVKVKGGWRIYSSGPGIYLNQLVTKAIGITTHKKDLVIDPVLPQEYDGLTIKFSYCNKPVCFKFALATETTSTIIVNDNKIEGESIKNPYRQSGIRIKRNEIEPLLNDIDNIIEVFYHPY